MPNLSGKVAALIAELQPNAVSFQGPPGVTGTDILDFGSIWTTSHAFLSSAPPLRTPPCGGLYLVPVLTI